MTCVIECSGDYCTNNTGNPIGYCSCSIANSPHCTTEASWGPWGACIGGFQTRYCPTYGQDSQVRACTATPPPTGNGGGPTPVPGAPVPLNPTSNLSCPTTNPTNVLFQWSSVSGTNNYHLKIDNLSNGWAGCPGSNAGDYCIDPIYTTGYSVSLPANQSYSWWVSAYDSSNNAGPQSNHVNFSIPAVCSPTPSPSPAPVPCSVTTSPAVLKST